jgi:hypothetical protein
MDGYQDDYQVGALPVQFARGGGFVYYPMT